MSAESFSNNEPLVPKETRPEKLSKKFGLGKSMRRLAQGAALAGGLLSATGERVDAQSIHMPYSHASVSFDNPFKKHVNPEEIKPVLTEEEKAKIDTVLQNYTVKKDSTGKNGEQLYTVTEKKTGYSYPLGIMGSPNTGIEHAILLVYESIKSRPETEAILNTERAFIASGLVEPNGNPNEKLHEEARAFKGYGLDVKTKVLVDEHGKVVKLLKVDGRDINNQ